MKKKGADTSISFTAVLEKSDTGMRYFFITVPSHTAALFIEGTRRRVICTLNATETFQAGLMPLKKGDCFITVNKTLRDSLKLKIGQQVDVMLEKDTSEFGLPVPEEFTELMAQDEEGSVLFMKLTDGKKRTLLYLIGKPKGIDARIRIGMIVLEHLKRNKGKINYKQLYAEMKPAS
jgi:hypothetical protein